MNQPNTQLIVVNAVVLFFHQFILNIYVQRMLLYSFTIYKKRVKLKNQKKKEKKAKYVFR